MLPERLDDTTFLLYASKNYNNVGCYDIQEFKEDLSRIVYVRRLLQRYRKGGELKERLILNHIIVLCNVFTVPAAVRMLFYKMEDFSSELKTFLVYLDMMPEEIHNIGVFGKTFFSNKIGIDNQIEKILRDL